MKITKLVLDTLESTQKNWQPKNHNPSSASFRYADGTVVGPDKLSQFLKWTGVKPSNPPDGPALLKMRLGDAAHEALAKVLEASGIKVMTETSFKHSIPGLKHQVSGRTDFLAEVDGVMEVLEAKSSSDQAMFGKGWGISDKGPKEDHLLQVICYLNCVVGVKRGRLIYIARDSGKMLEFVIERDGEDHYAVDGKPVRELSWSGIIQRWAEIEKIVESGIAPEPDYKAWISPDGKVMDTKQIAGVKYKTPWRAVYNDYKDYIWSNPDNYKYSMNYWYEQRNKENEK